ncbi:hypothetical protein E2C01_046258 [Portunus trituberculatus]|uniref:Uncharacterized protein n=1 Tax=Portunus trituberculatus TaxID=210409 RepID=A0A5B7FXD6_PORTR|nr:hypothetical protein [Portunus trituberculatus]
MRNAITRAYQNTLERRLLWSAALSQRQTNSLHSCWITECCPAPPRNLLCREEKRTLSSIQATATLATGMTDDSYSEKEEEILSGKVIGTQVVWPGPSH